MGRRRVTTAILLILGLAAAGCGGDDGGGGGAGNDAPRPVGGSFVDRLALLPGSLADGDGGILVTVADVDAAAKAAGVSPPGDVTDQDAVTAYLKALQGVRTPGEAAPPVVTPLPERIGPAGLSRAGEFDAELGWSVLDVRWFVEYPTPPATLTVLGGTFTEQRLTAAMGAPADGRWRVGAGEDLSANLKERTVARPLGQPLTVALDSGRLVVSPSAGQVDAAVGAGGGTLADVPELRALAQAMTTEGAYATMLSARGRYQVGPDASPLRPFGGVATGLVLDGQPFLVLAYAHADAATAEANATALRTHLAQGRSLATRQPWSELLTAAEIRVDGTTLVARLALGDTPPAMAWQLLTTRDSLVQHGR
ncbi:hypothetical protein [Micromonospora fluostatini]|uniref:hypothetical protein n=1 Tax=Micromonospora sp. JCM 30529 TaxID=3421643 RepID=UPI003D178351